MKIRKISVKGLFHTFNHEIRFNSSDIVIIIGENGIGKTTILQIVNSIFTKKFDFLFSIDFDLIELDFSKIKWIIKKDDEGNLIISNPIKQDSFIVKPIINNRDAYFLRRFLEQINDEEWFDRRIGRPVTRDEIIKRYGQDPITQSATPIWFDELIKENRVMFIQTQRLYKTEYDNERDSKKLGYMVDAYSNELVSLLRKDNTTFTSKSIQLDSTFPIRLLKVLKRPKKLGYINNIIDEINSLNQYRSLLSTVGIIDKQDDEVINNSLETLNNPSALSILDLYITDNKQKLDVFRDTAQKLNLLLQIINKRFKHKRLFIDKETGFIIKSNSDNKDIAVKKLSSGEQNELIIFYNLLFKTNKGDIVLIDEPEISLHIAWQQQLIKDLKEIAKETGISLLISTHSPDIIGDNWNLVQTLSSKE